MYRLLFVFILFVFSYDITASEKEKKINVDGYLFEMPFYAHFKNDKGFNNLFINKLNILDKINNNWNINLNLRNRLISGSYLFSNPTLKYIIDEDYGALDMSFNLAYDSYSAYLLNTYIDRFFVKYSSNGFSVSFGRQRYDLSLSQMWSPNDFVNPYSYINFNYAEKNYFDGLSLSYKFNNRNTLSSLVKVNNNLDFTFGLHYRYTRNKYIFQLVTGVVDNSSKILGAGFKYKGYKYLIDLESSIFYVDDRLNNMTDIDFSYNVTSKIKLGFEYLWASNLSEKPIAFGNYFTDYVSYFKLSNASNSLLFLMNYSSSKVKCRVVFSNYGNSFADSFYQESSVKYIFNKRFSSKVVSQLFYHNDNGLDGLLTINFKWLF